MKLTLSWLKEHLETQADVATITERLTAIGLEVESVSDPAKDLAPFVVGRVVEARPHPNADRLSVCLVEAGAGEVQVVCGAPNARSGMKGVFAPAGTTIPGTGLHLKRTRIRGVDSNGMLCSEREMGLSDDHETIIELPDDAPVGAPFTEVMGLNDPVIDVAVTPNRQDCLGVHGIARDLAAAGLGRLKPVAAPEIAGAFESPIKVHLEFTPETSDACPLFAGRYIRGVANRPSPRWLKDKLRAIGLRPISALVDITNYVTYDLGRPLHVFDADKVTGDIRVRLSRHGETIEALDGKSYTTDDAMCLIADDRGGHAFGGVMGGETTGCDDGTVNVFIESALFDPLRTAATGRKLGIESDARYRFERGVDPESAIPGMHVATRLILDLCGGEPSRPVIAGRVPDWRRTVTLRPERIRSLGGLDLPPDECRRILEGLAFTVTPRGEVLEVAVPSWRSDIDGEADLVEEVTRIHGYDRIPAVLLPRPGGVARPTMTLGQRRVRTARRTLAARGMVEAVTWSFMPSDDARLFGGGDAALVLANPISSDLDAMRPSVLPNLIRTAGRNVDRGIQNVRLFEVGPQYVDDTPSGQLRMVSGVRRGDTSARHWDDKPHAVDVFDAKADAQAVLVACGLAVDGLTVAAEAPDWYHPGRAGAFRLGPKLTLAWFGELHPAVLDALDVAGPLVGFEVFLDRIPERRAKGATKPALDVSDLPAVERDFAFVVDRQVEAQRIVRAARGAERNLITEVGVFDVFEGPGLGAGKKSVAISVRLEPREKTLTEPEIEAVSRRIVASVAKETGGVLRG